MKFSIITVCFNSAAVLPACMKSLADQTFSDYEWVVVDGASKDGTVELARRFSAAPLQLLSEPDQGIYDAMNKGARLARGEYIYFLNADDQLVDATVLADVARHLRAHPALDLLYGNAVYVSPDGQRSRQRYPHLTPRNLAFANLCHQATFARRALFERLGGFDLDFRIVADLDWLVRVLRSGASHQWMDRDICLYASDGFSAQQRDRLAAEKHRLQARLHGPWGAATGRLRYRLARKLRSLA